ncbi:MAG: hypothetical protein Q8O67_15930 [Deltaproteobacteria bacterium]|nr:hypothetical protein [Deltaproteobacteria bacterium]
MKTAAVVVGCLLPLVALALYLVVAGDLRVIQEGGIWSLALIGSMFLFGIAPPALVATTTAPRPVWAAMAMVPFLVGVAGTLLSSDMVAQAIASVSPADKLTMASVGAGEVASIFSLALLVGGCCVVGVALVLVVVERSPGAVLLLAVGGTSAVFGLRWMALREALIAMGSVSVADKVVLAAGGLASAQVLGLAVVAVAVVLLIGGAASLLRAGAWASVPSTIGLGLVATVMASSTMSAHFALSGLTWSTPAPFPADANLVVFDGDRADPPALWIKAGSEASLPGEQNVFVVDATATGRDVRRALVGMRGTDGSPERIFVGPERAGMGPDVDDLSMPRVLAPLFRDRITGVATAIATADNPPRLIVVLGPKRPTRELEAGFRFLFRSADGALDLGARPAALAFDDDVDAATFAAVLSRMAQPRAGLETPVVLMLGPPPSTEDLAKSAIVSP